MANLLVRNLDDDVLKARIASYESAAKLQTAAPEILDLASETESTKRNYGLDVPATAAFGNNCLLARRMIERGVRFVQVWSGHGGASGNWDNHFDIPKELGFIARASDQFENIGKRAAAPTRREAAHGGLVVTTSRN